MSDTDSLAFRPKRARFGSRTLWIAIAIVALPLVGFWGYSQWSAQGEAELAYAAARDALAQNQLDPALQKLDEAIRLHPTARYHHAKYAALMAGNRPYEATIALERARALEPRNAFYRYQAGLQALDYGEDPAKGLTLLREATELEPTNSEFRQVYGTRLVLQNQLPKGIAVLEALTRRDPHYVKGWSELAGAYRLEENPAAELTTRISATRKAPEELGHWLALGELYEERGNKPEAVTAYRRALALDPGAPHEFRVKVAYLAGEPIPEADREVLEDSIPVTFRNSHAFAEATVLGHKGLFLVDTGATHSIVYQRFLDQWGIAVPTGLPTASYQTGGGMISVPMFYTGITLGHYRLANRQVAILPTPEADWMGDGILGMNILAEFSVRLDSRRGRLILSRK